jgi:hypothetical protein
MRDLGSADRGRALRSGAGRGRATPTGVRHGATGAVVANAGLCGSGLGVVRAEAAACMEAMQESEREARERKGWLWYYTRLCSSGQHINQ